MIYAPTIDTQQTSVSYQFKDIQAIVFMVDMPYMPSTSLVLPTTAETDMGNEFEPLTSPKASTSSAINDYGFYDFQEYFISHNNEIIGSSKGPANYTNLSKVEESVILKRFISDIVHNSYEIPGEFAKLVHENFWDLVN